MFQSSGEPLLNVTSLNKFSLFSSEQGGIYGISSDDLPQTPRSPECSRTLSADIASSQYLDVMVNHLLMTPEQGPHYNTDIQTDCMAMEIFNKPDLIDIQLLTPIKNDNMNAVSTHCFTINESASANMFSREFFSQAAPNKISATTSDSSDQKAEITLCTTSRGCSLSISASRSTSISPANEVNDLVRNDISKVNFAPAKLGGWKMCNNQNMEDQHPNRFIYRYPGRQMRKSQRKQPKRRTCNGKKPLCGQGITQNVRPKLGNSLFPQRRSHTLRPQYEQIFELFRKPSSKFTEEEQKILLLDEGNVFVKFVIDQECSRFLQENLGSFTAEQLWNSFIHLRSDFVTICEDVFGNYVAQKYLHFGSNKLRKAILETLKTSIYSLSMNMYACRVVQKFLECEGQEQKLLVAQALSGSIIKMVYDLNGNHVVQKMIQCLHPSEIGFIADEILGQTFSLAMHPYGGRVIQQLLKKFSRKRVRTLLREITKRTVTLSKNQYGNYIIQWILKNYVIDRREIVRNLIGRVAELSKDKYASNVIEMAFKILDEVRVRELGEELLVNVHPSKGRYSPLALLVGDQFGNYVVQTLLESSVGAFRQRLIRSLSHCSKIKKDYGKNLLAKVGQISSKNNINAK